jgi:hypothetical protein
MCWRPQKSGYSYPRVVVIRIDVHPVWETQSTGHTLSTLDPRRVPDHISHVVHIGNLSLVPTRSKHAPTPGRSLDDQRLWHPDLRLNRIDRILIPQRYTFFSESPHAKNLGVKHAWPGAISRWVTDQEVFPDVHRWGQKCTEKTRVGL